MARRLRTSASDIIPGDAMILMLLRHAKAEPGSAGNDRGRALTAPGEVHARLLGKHLAEAGPAPQGALVSPARRTRQTFELVAGELGEAAPAADHDEALFEATADGLLAAVRRVEGAECLLVVGHNPAVAELAAALAGDGDPAERQRLAGRFPPGSLAVLDCPIEAWSALQPGGGRLRKLVLPDDLATR